MKGVYSIMRSMLKRGYLMRDTSVDIFGIDSITTHVYNDKNKGSAMKNEGNKKQ